MTTQQYTAGGYTIRTNGTNLVSDLPSNHDTDRAVLNQWSQRPDHFMVYVAADSASLSGYKATTWLGAILAHNVRVSRPFRSGFGGRQQSIRFTGTNGARYYGRMSADMSECCLVHRYKTGVQSMKVLLQRVDPHVALFRDPTTGIAWVENGHTGIGHSAHPNISATGSIRGVKQRGYWNKDARCVRSHGFIYNIDEAITTDDLDTLAQKHCQCGGRH